MVLGLRTKNRKGSTVQVDYVIHIQEIKPWPPSQSLRSLRSVLLQWENGERHSGSTSAVIPIIGSGVGDGNIEFNESFRLPVSLSREVTLKGGDAETFQKNCLELNLYETRRDKTVKGQLLGNAVIDLSEYGIIKEAVSISTPVNCKRSFRNTAQPVLFVKILPFDKENSSSSSKGSLAKEISLDKDSRESISALMNGEYAEEAEFASFTDDDVSSHSSLIVSPSAFEANTDSQSQNGSADGRLNEENASGAVNNRGRVNGQPVLPSEPVHAKSVPKPVAESYASNQALRHITLNSSQSSSMDLSYDPGSSENDDLSTSNLSERSLTAASKKYEPDQTQSSSSPSASEGTDGEVRSRNSTTGFYQKDMVQEVHKVVDSRTSEIAECQIRGDSCTNGFGALLESSDSILRPTEKPSIVNIAPSDINEDWNGQLQKHRRNGSEEATRNSDIHRVVRGNKSEEEYCTNGRGENLENKDDSKEHGCLINLPPNNFSPASITKIEQTSVGQPPKITEDAIRNLSASDGNVLSLSKSDPVVKANSPVNGILKHKKMSVRSPLDSSQRSISGISSQFIEEIKEIDILEDACKEITDAENRIFSTDKVKYVTREMHDFVSDGKIRELELRVANLERELREVAALEAGLYSVVSEHGGSAHKVHAPARRLSRIYIHACKHWSMERRASAARSAVSGLVLVAKACGNDVPRLTFWLSNSIVLRAIISQYFGDSHLNLAGPQIESDCGRKGNEKKYTPLKWKDTFINEKEVEFSFGQALDDWQDRHTFTSALEKIESWIFSRIIESLWWQTLTPHMQSPIEKENGKKMGFHQRKSYGRISSLNNQEQGNFSITLWKRAFKDACERLCPVRAGGHECGCLPMLARLVMEQCVARLDVAMFNAILRESDDDIPTDPISDPISDSKVLPVPSGKTSFSAGAQLKNAIGNWSRWLTDLFGIDADDSPEIDSELDDERLDSAESFKSFHLLNALSDLLMLPKDMLLDESIRKEVCPTFGAPLIKRILCDFVPDEFCPDPIPEIVLESLDSENSLDCNEESIEHFPWKAVSIVYSPPSVASVSAIIGNLRSSAQLGRSGSSVLRKCHTSDDELDELDSPFMSIAVDKIPAISGQKLKEFADGNGGSALRYQLLREVWMDGDR